MIFDFDNRTRKAKNVIVINNESELPTPTDTEDGLGMAHRLENGKVYEIGSVIYLSYPLVLNNNTIRGAWQISIIWLGTGALIRNNPATPLGDSQIYSIFLYGDGTNTAFDLTAGDILAIDYSRVINIDPGLIKNINNLYCRQSAFIEQTATLTVEDIGDIFYFFGIYAANSTPIGDALFTFKGATRSTEISNVEGIPVAWDSLFNIDSATYTGRVQINLSEAIALYGGIPFHANSLDQTNPRVDVNSYIPVPDSQTIGSLYMERNPTITDPTIKGETGDITAFADAGSGQVTVTSAGHGLSNGDIVWLLDDTYTGKYTISNVATDDFEITTTYTGTSTGSWETGWTKVAGTTYEMENERASMTDNNEITFVNLEEKKVTVNVSTNPRNNIIASSKDWEFSVMKNDVRIKGSLKFREMGVKAGEGVITATSSVVSGDYFEVYVRNISDTTTNMIMENMSMVIE